MYEGLYKINLIDWLIPSVQSQLVQRLWDDLVTVRIPNVPLWPYSALHYSTVHYSIVHYSTLHYSTVDYSIVNKIKCIYIALLTSADISKCCTETQPKTPNSKQCRCRSTLARRNSLERPKPRNLERNPAMRGDPLLAVSGGDYNRTWPRC